MIRPPSPTRRALLAGAAGVLLAPNVSFAAETGRRGFRFLRGDEDIGSHVTSLTRSGDELQLSVDIRLQVKRLGVTVFRYEMTNRELWRAGRLVSMNSVVNDDGDDDFVRAKAVGDRIEIDGSGYQGSVPADSASTTYFTPAFLKRPIWINTQTGVPISVTTAAAGAGSVQGPSGPVATEKWTAKGENLDIVLHYANREWVGIEFDANGEPGIYRPDNVGPAFMPLWDATA